MTSESADFGRAAENKAADYLSACGYRVLERSFRCPMGEVDIIAMDGEAIVFVEVKARTRSDYGGAVQAVTKSKCLKIEKTALSYLKYKKPRHESIRFDIVGVGKDGSMELLKNAFPASGRYFF